MYLDKKNLHDITKNSNTVMYLDKKTNLHDITKNINAVMYQDKKQLHDIWRG